MSRNRPIDLVVFLIVLALVFLVTSSKGEVRERTAQGLEQKIEDLTLELAEVRKHLVILYTRDLELQGRVGELEKDLEVVP